MVCVREATNLPSKIGTTYVRVTVDTQQCDTHVITKKETTTVVTTTVITTASSPQSHHHHHHHHHVITNITSSPPRHHHHHTPSRYHHYVITSTSSPPHHRHHHHVHHPRCREPKWNDRLLYTLPRTDDKETGEPKVVCIELIRHRDVLDDEVVGRLVLDFAQFMLEKNANAISRWFYCTAVSY
jgi:hypothetical protein